MDAAERQRARVRQHYANNPDYYKAKAKAQNTKRREELREQILAYLLENPCACGEADPCVLDFDHVRGEKVDTINRLVRKCAAWSRIEEEIAKCEVRCANCHRRRTAEQFGWWSAPSVSS